MVEPTVTRRIEQRHNLARNRIDTGQVRAFPKIAAMTSKGQIAGIVGTTMLAG
jgi:alkylated DNA nucleotide flippase Atl1